MGGGDKSAATRCGTFVVGTPVDPPVHAPNQLTATWIASEARPASFQSTVGGLVSDVVMDKKGDGDKPCLQVAPASAYASLPGVRSVNGICTALNQYGKRFDDAKQKAEELAGNIWHHVRTSPSIGDAAIARLAQGTKILKEGGRDKIFENTFGILPKEKILKAYACYLSTSSGLVIAGTLYLSNKRLVFGGDNPRQSAPSGQQEWMNKVDLLLDNLSFVSPSANERDASQKHIQVITRDGYEFLFMGFVSYDKALKNITEALQHCRDNKPEGCNLNKSQNGEQTSNCT